jgi:murein DD-endopeptidase MepM/ murein hydrolase activator NlpD
MKKSKTIFGKIILMMLIGIVIFVFNGALSTPMNANSEGVTRATNSYLTHENMELKSEYAKLEKKLAEMEQLTKQIYEYDNVIYSQVLGVDFDTTEFHRYKNDSIDFVVRNHDSIFTEVNDRAFYAAEMLALQLEKLQETSRLFKNNKNAINYYPTISPIKTKDFINLSSPYGWRDHPTEKQVLFHEGVDISAYPGTPVYSTAQGTIVKILYSKHGYGNRVVIKHAYGFETLYAHLGVIKVKKGQWVRKNQIIGTVGNTGRSTGPHLHYEIRKNNEPRDPLGYFYTHLTEELLAMN